MSVLGNFISSHDITLDDYYKYYRENYSVSNKRPRTIEYDDYIFKSKIHLFIGYKKISSIIRQDIERICCIYNNIIRLKFSYYFFYYQLLIIF